MTMEALSCSCFCSNAVVTGAPEHLRPKLHSTSLRSHSSLQVSKFGRHHTSATSLGSIGRVTMSGVSGGSEPNSKRLVVTNPSGENLVGILHQGAKEDVVILCHGFRSTKESSTLTNLDTALSDIGFSTFRFDFSGNGESEGKFQYGNYWKEVEDLRSVVLHLTEQGRKPKAIIGHSKGGNVVLLYASKYGDVHTVVNLSGRFNLQRGVKERLGEKGLQMIEQQGYVEVKDRNGNVEYTVTKTSLEERLSTDMKSAVLSISKDCRVLTVHGSEDKIVDVGDATEFDRVISNHKLHILLGANHGFTDHRDILATHVVDFLNDAN